MLVLWMFVRNWLFKFLFLDVFFIRFVILMNFIVVGKICWGFIIVVNVFKCVLGIGIMLVFGLMV